MNTSTIPVNVKAAGEIYIATTQRFPEAKGLGSTPKEAADRLSEELEKFFFPLWRLDIHPLGATIRGWFETQKAPPMPFFSANEFSAALEALDLDPAVSEQLTQTYADTAILGSFLVGGEYDERIHEALYITSGHPLGFALAYAAGLAFRHPQFTVAFCRSTRTPGFLKALEAWAVCNELTKPFDGKKELSWVNRHLVSQNHPAASYWQNACQRSFENISKFNKALANEVSKAEAAARGEMKRRKAGAQERDAEFIHSIKLLWAPAALWCLSDSDIVALLDPKKTEGMSEAYEKVRRNISSLKFTKSRLRAGHQAANRKK